MRFLRNRVHVGGEWFPAGTAESELPAGLEIPNPKAWIDTDEMAGKADVGPPPKSGPGSSREEWIKYVIGVAEQHDLDIESFGEKPTKAKIIEILTVAGVPTE